jgi:hypothetical protein
VRECISYALMMNESADVPYLMTPCCKHNTAERVRADDNPAHQVVDGVCLPWRMLLMKLQHGWLHASETGGQGLHKLHAYKACCQRSICPTPVFSCG